MTLEELEVQRMKIQKDLIHYVCKYGVDYKETKIKETELDLIIRKIQSLKE